MMNQIIIAVEWLGGLLGTLGLLVFWLYLRREHDDSQVVDSPEEVDEEERGRNSPLDERASALAKKMSDGDRCHYG